MMNKEIYLKDPFNMQDFEKFAESTEGKSMLEFLNYPKDWGNGIWEISKGLFTGYQGVIEFDKAFRKKAKEYGK